jgi:hypothetical protein
MKQGNNKGAKKGGGTPTGTKSSTTPQKRAGTPSTMKVITPLYTPAREETTEAEERDEEQRMLRGRGREDNEKGTEKEMQRLLERIKELERGNERMTKKTMVQESEIKRLRREKILGERNKGGNKEGSPENMEIDESEKEKRKRKGEENEKEGRQEEDERKRPEKRRRGIELTKMKGNAVTEQEMRRFVEKVKEKIKGKELLDEICRAISSALSNIA